MYMDEGMDTGDMLLKQEVRNRSKWNNRRTLGKTF
jgi:methionyl-tRNA formyltransferase